MRSRVASRTTRTSPCLRRKLEISSVGDSAAITGVASSRKPAIALPIARRVIVPQESIAHETSVCPAASPSAMWTLQGTGGVLLALFGHPGGVHAVSAIGGRPDMPCRRRHLRLGLPQDIPCDGDGITSHE